MQALISKTRGIMRIKSDPRRPPGPRPLGAPTSFSKVEKDANNAINNPIFNPIYNAINNPIYNPIYNAITKAANL